MVSASASSGRMGCCGWTLRVTCWYLRWSWACSWRVVLVCVLFPLRWHTGYRRDEAGRQKVSTFPTAVQSVKAKQILAKNPPSTLIFRFRRILSDGTRKELKFEV